MSCVSINVTGGSNKRDIYLNKTNFAVPDLFARETPFPAMFVANIPVSDSTTAQGTDVKFPNLGASVEDASANKADILVLSDRAKMRSVC